VWAEPRELLEASCDLGEKEIEEMKEEFSPPFSHIDKLPPVWWYVCIYIYVCVGVGVFLWSFYLRHFFSFSLSLSLSHTHTHTSTGTSRRTVTAPTRLNAAASLKNKAT
jgi:hypothetical protein